MSAEPSASHAVHTDALHRAHAHSVFSYCVRRLRSREEAEDAVQIVFLNAQRSLERGIEPEFQRAWLLKIAERVVSNVQRASRRRARVEFPVDPEGFADIAHTHSGATHAPLMEALSRISEKQRRALILCEVHGLSHAEASAELGISRNAVAALLARARRSLAVELSRPETRPRVRISSCLSALFDLEWLVAGAGGKIAAGGASLAVVALVSHPGYMLGRAISSGEAHAAPSAATSPRPAGLRAGRSALPHRSVSPHGVRKPLRLPPPVTAVSSAARAAPGPGPAVVDTLAPPDETAPAPVEPQAAPSGAEPDSGGPVLQTGGSPAPEGSDPAGSDAGAHGGPAGKDDAHPSPASPQARMAAPCADLLPCAADPGAPSDVARAAQENHRPEAASASAPPSPPRPVH